MARRPVFGCRTLLTGASSGIGRALAVELARRGARLVLVARREHKLRELAAELTTLQAAAGAHRGRPLANATEPDVGPEIVVGDVTEPSTRQRAIDRAIQVFGGLDLLINNAGAGARGRFSEATAEQLRAVMEVDFFAVAELIRIALPHLARGRRPMVVNMGSILGHRAIPFASEYCAAKFAVRGLSESLRAELSRIPIELLVVSPGATNTEFSENLIGASDYPWGEMPRVSAESVALATLRAIERGRSEVFVNWRGWLLVWLNRFAPRLVDRVMSRYG